MNTEYYNNKLIELHEELSDLEIMKADIVGMTRAPLGSKSLDYRIRVLETRIEDINKRLRRQQDAAKNWEIAHAYKIERVVVCERNIAELQKEITKRREMVDIGTENPLQIAAYVNAGNEIRKYRKELSYLRKVVADSERRKPTYAKIGTVRNPEAEKIIHKPGTLEDGLAFMGIQKPRELADVNKLKTNSADVLGVMSIQPEEKRPPIKDDDCENSIADSNQPFEFTITGDTNA
jgi:hypothetical protein